MTRSTGSPVPAPRPSAAERQRTCAACGAEFRPGDRTEVEVLLDGEIRYVAVHGGHTTYSPRRERAVKTRLHRAA
jgi:hypothetical protein